MKSTLNEQPDKLNACGFCNASESRKLYQTSSVSGEEFFVNRCQKCNAAFLTPRPTTQQLEQAYDDSYYGSGESKFCGPIQKAVDYFRQGRSRLLSRYIKAPAKVLDIGCGDGRFLDMLIEQGYEGYGIELPGKAAQRASQIIGLKLKIGQLAEEDFNANFFDCVCMWHVFEHLTEPQKTLEIIKKILKPGGYLMMSLPNIDSLQGKLFKGNWLHLDPPKHLFFMNSKDLTAILEGSGFNLVRQSYFSLEQNPFGIQQSILNCLLRKRDVLFEALKGNSNYVKEYSKAFIMLQKLFFVGSFPLFAILAWLEAVAHKGGTMELFFKKTW